jgi:hypothetical protein
MDATTAVIFRAHMVRLREEETEADPEVVALLNRPQMSAYKLKLMREGATGGIAHWNQAIVQVC